MVAILLAASTFLGSGQVDRFNDIPRFLARARFHAPDDARAVADRAVTLYYDDKGADFTPWIRRLLAEVARTWMASLPDEGNVSFVGHTAVGLTAARDGTVGAVETIVPSRVPGFDEKAVSAVREARLLSLPSDYPDEEFGIIVVLWVNEPSHDIFEDKSDLASSTPDAPRPTPPANSDLDVDADLGGRELRVNKNAIIYNEPTGTSQRLARLAEDETVLIVAKAQGDFWEVQYGDVHGFVHDLLLSHDELSEASDGNGLAADGRANWDVEPVLIFAPGNPSYPAKAFKEKIQGNVILQILVKSDGSTKVVEVLETIPYCTEVAKAHAKLHRWKPALKDGKPIEALGIITVHFNIPRNQ